jgi:hypothetical protein
MSKFIKEMLSGESGSISHKRILGSFGFVVMTVTMSVNALYPKEVLPSPELIQAVEWLTMSALFGTVIEKFAKK